MTRVLTAITLASTLAVVSAGQAYSHDESFEREESVLLTLTAGAEQGGKVRQSKTYTMVLGGDGGWSKVDDGSRIAFSTKTVATEADNGESAGPATSYAYRSIGFSARAEGKILPDRRFALQLRVDDSKVDPKEAPLGLPTVRDLSREIRTVLVPGKISRVASQTDSEGRTEFIDVMVEILE